MHTRLLIDLGGCDSLNGPHFSTRGIENCDNLYIKPFFIIAMDEFNDMIEIDEAIEKLMQCKVLSEAMVKSICDKVP